MWLSVGYVIPMQGDKNLNKIRPSEEFFLLAETGDILEDPGPQTVFLLRAEAP
jgi:hypothetical protein